MPDNAVRWCFDTAKLPVIPDNAARLCFVVGVAKKASVWMELLPSSLAQHSAASCDGGDAGDAGDGRAETPERDNIASLDAERRAEWMSAWWCGYAWSTENTFSSRA